MTPRVWIAVAIAGVLMAPACGQKKDRNKKEAVPTAAGAKPKDRYGGFLRLHSNEPQYLNPVLQTRFERVTPLVFEGLVGMDARMEPVKRLAENWEISESGKIITFRLRKNVKWQDGQPFTAQDVKFTYDAIQKTSAPTLWKAYMETVESVEITNDNTVVVIYKVPYALALTAWTVGIIPKHVYDTGDKDPVTAAANEQPVGTGPYKVSSWEKKKRLVLTANKDWWYGRPYIDSIEVQVGQREDQILEALRQNQLDFAEIPDIQVWANEAQLPEFQERFAVADVVEPRFYAIAWNESRKTYEDKRVRQALTFACDRGKVVDDVLLGQARVLDAPFFPGMFGPDPSIAPYPFDLDKAVKLLDEAGHKSVDGKRFDIDMIAAETARGAVTDAAFAIYRHDLEAIGIDLKITYLAPEEFTNRVVMRDFDAAYFGWLPDLPDPDPYPLLHSSMIKGGSIHAGYANPDVDRLLDEARATSDRDQRKALYFKVHRILHDEMPYTVVYSDYGHYAYNRRLHGVDPDDVGPVPRFPGVARWWIDDGAAAGDAVAKPAP
jgi:peptide/nickel transport system substrate-binding protein